MFSVFCRVICYRIAVSERVGKLLRVCLQLCILTARNQRGRTGLQRTHVILLGAGWYQYQDEPTGYTKRILKTLLDGQYLHAVRDEYTRQRLLKLGITNVLNTACPTMWGLTADKCAQIPTHKAERVVTTLTDYRSSTEQDAQMLTMLQKHYREV